jgi:hypothetical protein
LADFALGLDLLDGYDNQSFKIRDTTQEGTYEVYYVEAKDAIKYSNSANKSVKTILKK